MSFEWEAISIKIFVGRRLGFCLWCMRRQLAAAGSFSSCYLLGQRRGVW